MGTAAPWLDTDRDLLFLVRRIHDLFTPQKNYQWLLGQLAEYVRLRDLSNETEQQWHAERRRYFEVEVFRRGMNERRNQLADFGDDFEWDNHCRYLKGDEIDSVSASLKQGHFTTFDLVNGEEVPRRVQCFERAGGLDWIHVQAWTPKNLVHFDTRTLCHLPLPPVTIGRPYHDAEICMGLAILHDSAGTFASLIPRDGELGESLSIEWFWNTALAKGIDDYPKTGAKLSWSIRIEPFVNQVEESMSRVVKTATARTAKATGTVVKKITINARMIDVLQKIPDANGWTVTQWKTHLGCSRGAIAKAPVWQSLKVVKAEQQLSKAQPSDRRRKSER